MASGGLQIEVVGMDGVWVDSGSDPKLTGSDPRFLPGSKTRSGPGSKLEAVRIRSKKLGSDPGKPNPDPEPDPIPDPGRQMTRPGC